MKVAGILMYELSRAGHGKQSSRNKLSLTALEKQNGTLEEISIALPTERVELLTTYVDLLQTESLQRSDEAFSKRNREAGI